MKNSNIRVIQLTQLKTAGAPGPAKSQMQNFINKISPSINLSKEEEKTAVEIKYQFPSHAMDEQPQIF